MSRDAEALMLRARRLMAESHAEIDRSRVVSAELNLDRAKAFRRLSPVESVLYAERARSALAGLGPVITEELQRRVDRIRRELEELNQ